MLHAGCCQLILRDVKSNQRIVGFDPFTDFDQPLVAKKRASDIEELKNLGGAEIIVELFQAFTTNFILLDVFFVSNVKGNDWIVFD